MRESKEIKKPGSYLLSHGQAAVPSACGRFTYVFGMGTCVSARLWPPGRFRCSVRDGNVCFSPAMATRKVQVLMRVVACILNPLSGDENDNMVKPHGSLVPVG